MPETQGAECAANPRGRSNISPRRFRMKPVAFKTKRSAPARMPYTESRVGAPLAFSNDGRGRHAWPPAIQKMSRQNVTELEHLLHRGTPGDEVRSILMLTVRTVPSSLLSVAPAWIP